MQVEAVVVAPPDRADRVGLFKNRGVETPGLERRRDGEAGWTRADDDGVA